VIAAGDTTPFYLNAVYMKGWSTFKRTRYRASIASFTEVLDRSLPEGKTLDDLSKSQKNLIADTLRVMSLVFSYLDGADTISEVYLSLGERHYKHLLYASLGQLYFEKDRFRDSADTYLHYVRRFPNSDHSPSFNVKAIEVYEQGGFPSLVLPAKEEYVSNYGISSEFWRSRDESQRGSLKPKLKTYLVELSSYYHADAQALDQALVEYNKARQAGKKPKTKPEASQKQYLKAANLYGEFALTFANDAKTPEMVFLQGEAYYSAKYLPEAVQSFETVAFEYVDQKFGPDAGYNAILVSDEILTEYQSRQNESALAKLEEWTIRKINSSISYADYYSTDERAAPVLTKATQDIFERSEFQRAITLALRLTEWQPPQDPELKTTAWFVLAHSYFDLEQFSDAESAYRTILGRLPAQDQRRKDVVDRIAASIYRQSEFLVAAGDKAGAVARLLQIRDIAPGSEIAITAQYDAINHLLELKQWAQAESELDSFKASFPSHKFTATLAPKYVLVYQETEQWSKAASVLSVMSQSGNPEERRTSLYLAAELYERSGDINKAITHYREYAHTYPEPFGIATEARFHMVELYEKTNEPQKKDYWLKKLIEADATAGSARTLRSRSLAAMASAKFADDEFKNFQRIKLTLPIKKSMKGKKKAMDRTLDKYKALIDYGIADYVTEANHRIAEIYISLSRDLMDSQRPKGLDELALEQYEILLEEQAYPFEEKAIDIYKSNIDRAKQGIYDKWVKESFKSLASILPARYAKQEKTVELSDDIF
jgi:TolA-binding protein